MASPSDTAPAVLQLDDAGFDRDVLEAAETTLVDVWASWCGPCRLIAPLMDWAATTYADRLRVGKLEADANPRTRDAYGVHGLPTLILFHGGQEIARHEGVLSQAQLKAFLDAHL